MGSSDAAGLPRTVERGNPQPKTGWCEGISKKEAHTLGSVGMGTVGSLTNKGGSGKKTDSEVRGHLLAFDQ